MATEYGHETFWDPALRTPQKAGSVTFDGDYAMSLFDPTISLHDFPVASQLRSMTEPAEGSSPSWYGHQSTWRIADPNPSIPLVEFPQGDERPKRISIKPQLDTRRRTTIRPLGQTLERRRQRNRAAQSAFRERSKKHVEERRQELTKCLEYSQNLFCAMRELLERTEALKVDIEGVLALDLPLSSVESSHCSRMGSEVFH